MWIRNQDFLTWIMNILFSKIFLLSFQQAPEITVIRRMSDTDPHNAEMHLVNPQDIFKNPPDILRPQNDIQRQNSSELQLENFQELTDEDLNLQLFLWNTIEFFRAWKFWAFAPRFFLFCSWQFITLQRALLACIEWWETLNFTAKSQNFLVQKILDNMICIYLKQWAVDKTRLLYYEVK